MQARVRLETPSWRRERSFLDAALRSRELHRGFVTAPGSSAEYRDYLRRTCRDEQESFFVVDSDSGALAGVVNINDIARSEEPCARLGYFAFVPLAGRGLMAEGLTLAIRFAFRELKLERLEANIQAHNCRSIALIEGLGFRHAGTAGYLKIGSRWRGHQRWTLRREEWYAGQSARPARV